MAARTFLTAVELERAKAQWLASSQNQDPSKDSVHGFSIWLGQILLDRLHSVKNWQLAEPIALGSWARDELCPGSDIDLLFVGDPQKALEIINHFNSEGWPIRHRVPEDANDWSIGVKAFDVLALLMAKGLTPAAEIKLQKQLELKQKDFRKRRKYWLSQIENERKERAIRLDSIVNYLEPNLKFGPGGIRDLQQGLIFSRLRPQLFETRPDIQKRLQELNSFFLWIRQRLHLLGFQDVLLAPSQLELCKALGFKNEQVFMSEVQRSLSEVSFYTDWISQAVRLSENEISMPTKSIELKYAFSILKAAKKNTITEEWLRRNKLMLPAKKTTYRVLAKSLNSTCNEKFLRSTFRSKLMHRIFPDLNKVTGLVQHDQYHRFSVDAHLLQVMREVLRARKKPMSYGEEIGPKLKKLKKFDWDVLFWSAFFHDLCKGQKGDHSSLGASLVKKQMTAMGFSLRMTVEVAWMVQEHLAMSQAAFRHNPRDSRTWQMLFDKGVRRDRILRLGAFTAFDIRGTNPEAWNPWKEKLLSDLIDSLISQRASAFMDALESIEKKNYKFEPEFLIALDPRLLESIPVKILAQDSVGLKAGGKAAPIEIFSLKSNEHWVRFHWPKDESGLFLRFVQALSASGASIQEAYIQTFAKQGVYDWFRIRISKTPTQIKKILARLLESKDQGPLPSVRFEVLDCTAVDSSETLVSFRGRDQRGALLTAASALHKAKLPINWAKLSTWGRQIDDVFAVQADINQVKSFIKERSKDLLVNSLKS